MYFYIKRKTMKNIISVLTIILVFSLVKANASTTSDGNPAKKSNKLSGFVIDKQTGESLSGVKIRIENSDVVVFTDIDGYFELENTNTNNSTLTFDYVSYQLVKVDIESENVQVELTQKDVIQ